MQIPTSHKSTGFVLLIVLVLVAISSFILIDGLQLAKQMQFVATTNYHALQQRNLSKSVLLKTIEQLHSNTDSFIPNLQTDINNLVNTQNHSVVYCFMQDVWVIDACQTTGTEVKSHPVMQIRIECLQCIDANKVVLLTSTGYTDNPFSYAAKIELIQGSNLLDKVKLLQWYKTPQYVQ
jgi:hypothetical protein